MFETNEIWVGPSPNWVEIGLARGSHPDGLISNDAHLEMFMAYHTVSGGFTTQYYSPGTGVDGVPGGEWADYLTSYDTYIFETYNGSGLWETNIHGHTGYSYNALGPVHQIDAGTEVAIPYTQTADPTTYGSNSNMAYMTTTRTWHSGWNGTTTPVQQTIPSAPPMEYTWPVPWTWLRTGMTATC